MVKLVLPLKFYDEGGRVLPPRSLWWCLLFIARSYVIFVFSLTLPNQSEKLLSIFYPVKDQLYTGLVIGTFAIGPILLVSFREKIWKHHAEWSFALLKPLLVLGLVADLGLLVLQAKQNYWHFSWGVGVGFILSLIAMYWLLSSHHLKVMLEDWRLRIADNKD